MNFTLATLKYVAVRACVEDTPSGALTLIGFSLPVRINLDSHIKGHEKPPRQTDVGQAPSRVALPQVSQSDGGVMIIFSLSFRKPNNNTPRLCETLPSRGEDKECKSELLTMSLRNNLKLLNQLLISFRIKER